MHNIPKVWRNRQLRLILRGRNIGIMRLVRAVQQDFDDIIAFYDDVTGRTPDMVLYARWSNDMTHKMIVSLNTYYSL